MLERGVLFALADEVRDVDHFLDDFVHIFRALSPDNFEQVIPVYSKHLFEVSICSINLILRIICTDLLVLVAFFFDVLNELFGASI